MLRLSQRNYEDSEMAIFEWNDWGIKMAKYLKITIHDNDFTGYYRILGETLLNMFRYHGDYPTEDNVQQLKYAIGNLWYSINQINIFMDNRFPQVARDYFYYPDLAIVDYLDIPKWGNGEDIYIPLFDGSDEIILN